jgi:hypothetical protein
LIIYFIFLRLRVQADWQHFLQATDSFTIPAGGPVAKEEFHRIALVVALAISNPHEWCIQMFWTMFICLFGVVTGETGWDVTRFVDRVKSARPRTDGDNSSEDTRLAKFFVNPEFGDMVEPSTILDRHGRIMVWYLPNIFSPCQIVCICFHLNIWMLNY